MMRVKASTLVLVAAVLAGTGPAERVAGGEPDGVILDGKSLWRYSRAFKDPDLYPADTKAESQKPDPQTAWFGLPPANWNSPDFDDSTWVRTKVPLFRYGQWGRKTPLTFGTAAILLRGKFEVKDPAQVQQVSVSLSYYGGAVVYLNGQEVARGHVPGDKPDLKTLAEDYPREVLSTPDGKPLLFWDEKNKANLALRVRTIANAQVPANALRKGVNVLAIEIHRARPLAAAVKGPPVDAWYPAEPLSVSLSASPNGSATPNLGRPAGIQVWTCLPDDTVTVSNYGDSSEPLRPISIAAARNSVFSGRLFLGSDQAIRGLSAKVSDLAQAAGGAKIPASAVRVRYAEPAVPAKCWVPDGRFDGLVDAIPTEIPVRVAPRTAGAVAELWLTVGVPTDAKPGRYQGTVAVAAEGLKSTTVPLVLNVSAWTMPDPKDLRIMNFGQNSPESIAKHYEVPMWSDKHLELTGKSLALMTEVNARQVHLDLALDIYAVGGNPESMIRWIKQPDGTYKHDFSVFDKYMDMAAKSIGKPTLLRVNCWGRADLKDGKPAWNPGAVATKVSGLDPATGKIEPIDQPVPGTEESYLFWKPVLDEVRKKIEARGWWDVTAMGYNSYAAVPIPQVVDVYKRIWPDGVWSFTGHSGTLGSRWRTSEKDVTMLVRYADGVWTRGRPTARGYRALLKPRPGFWNFTYRGHFDLEELALYRNMIEWEISAGHDGYSDFGVDFFPLKRPGGKGYYLQPCGGGTGGPVDGTRAVLAPGPDGAIVTERFEMLREGTEIAEAILFLEKALLEKRITGDLEQRVNLYLEKRGEAFVKEGNFRWGWINNRFDENQQLLALAGEVAVAAQGGR